MSRIGCFKFFSIDETDEVFPGEDTNFFGQVVVVVLMAVDDVVILSL